MDEELRVTYGGHLQMIVKEAVVGSGVTGGRGQGSQCPPPETSHRDFFEDKWEKTREGKKVKK